MLRVITVKKRMKKKEKYKKGITSFETKINRLNISKH